MSFTPVIKFVHQRSSFKNLTISKLVPKCKFAKLPTAINIVLETGNYVIVSMVVNVPVHVVTLKSLKRLWELETEHLKFADAFKKYGKT